MLRRLIERIFILIRSRLKYKLISIYVFIFILQCSVILFTFRNISNDKKNDVIDENIKLLRQANINYLSDVVKSIDRLMIQAFCEKLFWQNQLQPADNEDYINDNSRIFNVLSNIYSYTNYIDSVYLYFNKSQKLYIMDELSHIDIPRGIDDDNIFFINNPYMDGYEWYDGAIKIRGDLYISKNNYVRHNVDKNGKYILSFSRALFNPLNQNELISVISINMSYDFFEMLAKDLCKTGEELLIVAQDGEIIFSTQTHEIFSHIDSKVMKKINNESSWFAEYLYGKNSIILHNKSENPGWHMVKVIPYNVLMESIKKNTITNFVFTLAIFLIGIVLVIMIAIKIAVSINALAVAMQKYEEGYAGITVETYRTDEIGMLNRSFNRMVRKIDSLIELEYKAKLREKQARLEALQAQINPHFLNNTLQTVSNIAIQKNIPEIEKINNALSTILRYSLSKNNEHVTLRQELENTQNYIYIQKFRYGERISYETNLRDEIMNCLVPVLTLQPIVENSVKHGIERKPGNGVIRIWDEVCDSNSYVIVVEDNGNGMTQQQINDIAAKLSNENREENSGWNGRGLININDRIRYYFGDSYGLRIESEFGKWMRVYIKLPFCVKTRGNDHNEIHCSNRR